MFNCWDQLGSALEIVVWEVVILLGYKHWNQYYYAKMDDDTFELYYKYHLSICEREELLGASSHVLDILKK